MRCSKKSLWAAGLAALLAAAPADSQGPAAIQNPSYADLADLSLAAPVAAHVRLRRAIALKPAEAGTVPAGKSRFYVEADVVSAHRMPAEMLEYGRHAHERGLRVLIAGAGGAAHLPGMLASVTPLPVIGVPVPLKHLDGMDSLLSIVQMPAGVPVATVGIGNARNAGLLAVRILAATDEALRAEMVTFQESLRESASSKGAAVRSALPRQPGT